MKNELEFLIREETPTGFPIPGLSPARQERIRRMTMKKITRSHANSKRRTVTVVAVAALLVAMLSVTAGAAYAFGWFTADPVVGDHALTDPTDVETPATSTPYTEEELARKEAGLLQTYDDAEIADTGAVATTDNYRYTLEEMVATEHALQAIVRVDALNEEADLDSLHIVMSNRGNGSEFFDEAKSGGIDCRALEIADSTGYFLLTNNGGRNEEGDQIKFTAHHESMSLFIVPLEEVMKDQVVVPMDASADEDTSRRFETMTVTPLGVKLEGNFFPTDGTPATEISVTLKDGTTFAWEGHDKVSDYGTPGFLTKSTGCGPEVEDPYCFECWMFSQATDLGEIDHITVDGVDYPLN